MVAPETPRLPAALAALSPDGVEPVLPVASAGLVACTRTPSTAAVADGEYKTGETPH